MKAVLSGRRKKERQDFYCVLATQERGKKQKKRRQVNPTNRDQKETKLDHVPRLGITGGSLMFGAGKKDRRIRTCKPLS